MQIKVYIYSSTVKRYQTVYQTVSNPTRRDHRKTIKVIKVLRVKCALAMGIARGIVMAPKNRRLLLRLGTSLISVISGSEKL